MKGERRSVLYFRHFLHVYIYSKLKFVCKQAINQNLGFFYDETRLSERRYFLKFLLTKFYQRKCIWLCISNLLCSLVKLDADEVIYFGSLDPPCLFQKNNLHMLIKEQFFQHFIFGFALPKLDLPTGLVMGVLSSTEFLQAQKGTNTWLEPWKRPVIHRPRGRRIVDISFSTGSKCWSSLCCPEGPFLKEIHAFFFALLELMLHSLIYSYQSLHLLLFLLHACKSLQRGEKRKNSKLSSFARDTYRNISLLIYVKKNVCVCRRTYVFVYPPL